MSVAGLGWPNAGPNHATRNARQYIPIYEGIGRTNGEPLRAAYFVWPIKNSATASVAVIGGTGLKGMRAASANQYFAGASGFPDFMIFGLDMLRSGSRGVRMAGFFDNNWTLVPDHYITNGL